MEVVRFEFMPALVEAFVELPWQIHGGDRHWVPPFMESVKAQLAPDAPFRKFGQMVHFLALDGNKPVARCSAILNARYEEDGHPLGFIGYFEAYDRVEASEAVLTEALNWLRTRGVRMVRGPINTSTYHPYRFMTEGFEDGAFFLEPYNPRYYAEHWERMGFKSCCDYFSGIVDSQDCASRLTREYERTMAAGYTTRMFDVTRFEDELRLMYDLSTRIFTGAWMWRPLTYPEFRDIYSGMGPVLDPELCHFMYKGEEPVGFVFGLPDHAPAIGAMRGDRTLPAKVRFLLNKGKARQALLKTFGVVPEHRRGTQALALAYLFHVNAKRRGYDQSVHSLMRADNTSRRMSEKFGARPFKRYALYQYDLG